MPGQFALRHMEGGIHPFGGLGLLGLMLFLVFAAIVIALVIWSITRARSPQHQPVTAHPAAMAPPAGSAPSASDSARQIARERLARGEIDPDQYRGIIEALST